MRLVGGFCCLRVNAVSLFQCFDIVGWVIHPVKYWNRLMKRNNESSGDSTVVNTSCLSFLSLTLGWCRAMTCFVCRKSTTMR